MITYTNVEAYKSAILNELDTLNNSTTRQIIIDLIAYAEEKEKEQERNKKEMEAKNRPLRPKPITTRSAEYYRALIEPDTLVNIGLKDLIEGLLQLVTSMEQQLQD